MTILTYHSLDNSGSVVSVSPQTFEWQMADLAEAGYQVVSLRHALAEREQLGGNWPENTIVLTFDDGFANFHDHALPVLLRYGFTATVFVVTGYLDGINNWQPPPKHLGTRPMLSWSQVEDVVDHRIEIAAHTINHPDMTKLPPAEVKREILESADILGMRLGRKVETFAYPYGHVDKNAAEIARTRFIAACTTELRRTSDDPLFLLPRIDMFYFRNTHCLRPVVDGLRDNYLLLRRWGRAIRYRLEKSCFCGCHNGHPQETKNLNV